jgi:hypothetical protein
MLFDESIYYIIHMALGIWDKKDVLHLDLLLARGISCYTIATTLFKLIHHASLYSTA